MVIQIDNIDDRARSLVNLIGSKLYINKFEFFYCNQRNVRVWSLACGGFNVLVWIEMLEVGL